MLRCAFESLLSGSQDLSNPSPAIVGQCNLNLKAGLEISRRVGRCCELKLKANHESGRRGFKCKDLKADTSSINTGWDGFNWHRPTREPVVDPLLAHVVQPWQEGH